MIPSSAPLHFSFACIQYSLPRIDHTIFDAEGFNLENFFSKFMAVNCSTIETIDVQVLKTALMQLSHQAFPGAPKGPTGRRSKALVRLPAWAPDISCLELDGLIRLNSSKHRGNMHWCGTTTQENFCIESTEPFEPVAVAQRAGSATDDSLLDSRIAAVIHHRTSDGSMFTIPILGREELQTVSPCEYFAMLLIANSTLSWALFTVRNITEVMDHVVSKFSLFLAPQAQLVHPFHSTDTQVR